jgi:MFS family permease
MSALPAAQLAATSDKRLGGPRAWAVLVLLTIVLVVSLLDRQIVSILAGSIAQDLKLTDTEIGLIYGTFFGVFYALFSIPLGRLADGWVRMRQIAFALFGWSAATFFGAFATGFVPLALARTAVGIGEAGMAPAGYSVIADLFEKRQRATAFALFSAGTAVGVGLSSAIGGGVADAWNHAFAGGHGWFGLVGWQAAFIVVSVPGLLLALLVWKIAEPPRGISDGIVQAGEPHPFRSAGAELLALLPGISLINLSRLHAPRREWVRNIAAFAVTVAFIVVVTRACESLLPGEKSKVYGHILGVAVTSHLIQWMTVGLGAYATFSWIQSQRLRDPAAHRVMWSSPTFIALLVIATFNMMIAYGLAAWGPLFAVQHYHAPLAEVGAKIGGAIGIAGLFGMVAGGWLADVVRKRWANGRLWVLLICITVPIPLAVALFSQPTLDRFAILHTILSLFLGGWQPCLTATLHDLVLPRMRGTAIAVLYLGMTVIGLGTGPYLVGLMSDVTGNLGASIMKLFAFAILTVSATLLAIRYLQRDEASLLARARSAGEPV